MSEQPACGGGCSVPANCRFDLVVTMSWSKLQPTERRRQRVEAERDESVRVLGCRWKHRSILAREPEGERHVRKNSRQEGYIPGLTGSDELGLIT